MAGGSGLDVAGGVVVDRGSTDWPSENYTLLCWIFTLPQGERDRYARFASALGNGHSRGTLRWRLALAASLATLAVVSGAPGARSAASLPPLRWTDATPDSMIDDSVAHALAPHAVEHA